METQKPAPIFVDGVNIKFPSEKAPTWVLLQMGFNAAKFFRWCQDHQDGKGWVNITVKKSQKGTVYAELDTWKPQAQPTLADIGEAKQKVDFVPDVAMETDEIPF